MTLDQLLVTAVFKLINHINRQLTARESSSLSAALEAGILIPDGCGLLSRKPL
jgi:hypothetical protein